MAFGVKWDGVRSMRFEFNSHLYLKIRWDWSGLGRDAIRWDLMGSQGQMGSDWVEWNRVE